MIEYDKIFSWMDKEKPAKEVDIECLKFKTLLPMTQSEIDETNHSHWDHIKDSRQEFDSSKWEIPKGTFPNSFVNFLRWSNGGYFENGERNFSPFFSPAEIRQMLLAYEFPEYMQGAVPFAFDGGGVFYIFDMRKEPADGEYNIYMAGSGALFWEDAVFVAETFNELINGNTAPYE